MNDKWLPDPPERDYLAALDYRLNTLIEMVNQSKDKRTEVDLEFGLIYGYSASEIESMYAYLVKLGYAKIVEDELTPSNVMFNVPLDYDYVITMEGSLFHANGGFKAEQQRNNTAMQRIQSLEDSKKDTDKQMIFLTYILAGAALLTFFVELLKLALGR